MSTLVSYEAFKLARTRDQVRRLVADFDLAMSELRAAFQPLATNSKILIERLDRAKRSHEHDCADHKRLQIEFKRAMTSLSLPELVEARDRYVALMERHRAERRRRVGGNQVNSNEVCPR